MSAGQKNKRQTDIKTYPGILLLNIAALVYLEYKYPYVISGIFKEPKFPIYKFENFIFVCGLTILMIQIAKKLYRADSPKSIELNFKNKNHKNSHYKKKNRIK